MMWTIKNK